MGGVFLSKHGLVLRILNIFILTWIGDMVLCQITPPPQLHDGPVIANNRVYYLKTFPARCGPPLIDTFPGGFVVKDSRALMRNNSPHIIRGNIEIAPTGCLYIEPGSVLKFAPGQGMIVNGTLIARVRFLVIFVLPVTITISLYLIIIIIIAIFSISVPNILPYYSNETIKVSV